MSNTIYLLWGAQFDELAATMFITQLRKAGSRVKVVALSPPPIVGSFGQALTADLTLHQALALKSQVVSLIIPGSLKQLIHLQNDPRLIRLLEDLKENGVTVFISEEEQDNLQTLPFDPEKIILYPDERELIAFIHHKLGYFQNKEAIKEE